MSLANDDLSPAAEAYVWGFPLVSVHRTRKMLCARVDSGAINHIDDLATPRDKAIVVPNNDTLYSSAWFDLRHGDLMIRVPPMDHARRYWNVMNLDGYTHVAYVCRRHHGTEGTEVRVTLDPGKPPTNDGSEVVTIGTPTAWVIIRVLVESPEDLAAARRLQRSIEVIAPEAHPHERTERAGRATAIAASGAAFFEELKAYVTQDPPAVWHPKLSTAAQAIVDNPTSVAMLVLEAGVKEGERRLRHLTDADTARQNGWRTGRHATGFDGDIFRRAAGAKFGLGGHQAIENRSYTAECDAAGQALNGDQPLKFKFEGDHFPPCRGFWSLTAYGTDLYLVDNEIDRWSLSDRTPGLVYAADGSLTIEISADRPANSANWLPVPSGPYLLGLRVYEGDPEVVACNWFPPALDPKV